MNHDSFTSDHVGFTYMPEPAVSHLSVDRGDQTIVFPKRKGVSVSVEAKVDACRESTTSRSRVELNCSYHR